MSAPKPHWSSPATVCTAEIAVAELAFLRRNLHDQCLPQLAQYEFGPYPAGRGHLSSRVCLEDSGARGNRWERRNPRAKAPA